MAESIVYIRLQYVATGCYWAHQQDIWIERDCVKGIENGYQCIVEIRGTTLVQTRSQGTSVSASDFHNARETIRNHVYDMEYKIIKKRQQKKTWIEADRLCINLTPNQYNALTTAIVNISIDITIPFNSKSSQ